MSVTKTGGLPPMNGSPLFGFCAKRGKLLEVMIRPSRWPAASVYARSLMSSTVRPYRVPDTTGEANRRSDLNTLGVVLYEMLAGQRCVPAGSHSEIMRAVISDAPIPLTTQPCDSNTARESGDEGTRKVAAEAVSKRKCVSKRASRRQHVDRRQCGCASHF